MAKYSQTPSVTEKFMRDSNRKYVAIQEEMRKIEAQLRKASKETNTKMGRVFAEKDTSFAQKKLITILGDPTKKMGITSSPDAPKNGAYILSDKSRVEYYTNGEVHHEDDKPAIIFATGTELYVKKGVVHRDMSKGPAVIVRDNKGYDILYAFIEDGMLQYAAEPDKNGDITCVDAEGRLHNPQGPAVITKNMRAWYQHGKQHRLNGPAIIYGNGDEVWYQNGEIHRDGNKPAITKRDGVRKWYLHGKPCRLSGSANVIYADGTQEWRNEDDVVHRDGDLPAIIRPDGTKEWLLNGVHHRDGDLPAIIGLNGHRAYYNKGVLHREVGPALIEPDKSVIAYYRFGELHRPGQKPALEKNSSFKEKVLVYAENGRAYATGKWEKHLDSFVIKDENGEYHTPDPENQAAIVYSDGGQEWYLHGKLHRDGDLPAIITGEGKRAWYQNGELHREGDLPAMVSERTQKWYLHGKLHRDNDLPAVIKTNGSQYWYQHDELHRDNDLPAVIKQNFRGWYQYGEPHRDGDRPAIMDGSRHSWYYQGKRHREGNKPAVEDTITGEFGYYRNDKAHRVAYPAIYSPLDGVMEYWMDGVKV